MAGRDRAVSAERESEMKKKVVVALAAVAGLVGGGAVIAVRPQWLLG